MLKRNRAIATGLSRQLRLTLSNQKNSSSKTSPIHKKNTLNCYKLPLGHFMYLIRITCM